MDESNFIKIKQQMDENNLELRDFMGDFDKWKTDVQAKNAKLSSEVKSSDALLPSIRNVLNKKKKKIKQKNVNCIDSEDKKYHKSERIKSNDYKAWEKFDVEKAIADVEQPIKPDETEESETDDEWEDERRLKLSEIEKDQGNVRFKEGKFAESIEHYTTAIRLVPENPLLYTNRALALFKLERFASAESDCSTALSIDPKLIKALYRRAQARKRLDKIEDAICDLRQILDVEHNNLSALKDLRKWTCDADLKAGSVNSLFKLIDPAKLDRYKDEEMRRIPISEVCKSKLVKGNLVATAPIGDMPQQPKQPIILDAHDIHSLRLNYHPAQDRTIKEVNNTIPRNIEPQILCPVTRRDPPTNWFQMDRNLRELCCGSSSQLTPPAIDYICAIQPNNYASIIGSNLDTASLSRMIRAISDSALELHEKCDRLSALSKLSRFDVAWMLAEEELKTVTDKIISNISNENQKMALSRAFS